MTENLPLQPAPALSVVIPAYNDAQALTLFLPSLCGFLAAQPGQQEIVIVDDGSRDALAEVCRDYVPRLPENTVLRLIRLSRNFGKEAALSAGLAQAQGEAVVMMDADGQHPVAVLAEMLALYTMVPMWWPPFKRTVPTKALWRARSNAASTTLCKTPTATSSNPMPATSA